MDNYVKRWFILFAGICANLCQGAAYASSVFAMPMMFFLHQTVMKAGKPAPDMAKWALAFSINLAMLPVGMLLTGRIADKVSPRLVVFLGALVFGGGMLLAGWTSSLMYFYVTFGIMMGLGSGMAYGAVVATSVRWFPERRGLASGLSVGALGLGTVLIAPIADKLVGKPEIVPTSIMPLVLGLSPASAHHLLTTFKILGVAFLAIMCLASIFMVSPPKDFAPAKQSAAAKKASAVPDVEWTTMLFTGKFWLLFFTYACGAFTGLMIISQAKPIAMDLKNSGMDPKALGAYAVAVVSSIGLANALGRVFWATVSDWIGRYWALSLMFLITAVTVFLMPGFAAQKHSLLVAGVVLGACYGGYLGIFPTLCADSFGSKNMALNYALLFFAFAVAAIAGPYAAGFIKNMSGSYSQAFVVAGAVATLGLVLTIIQTVTQPKAKAA
jgi:OFA family oxalate/formate antiporter-like MFS transporter